MAGTMLEMLKNPEMQARRCGCDGAKLNALG